MSQRTVLTSLMVFTGLSGAWGQPASYCGLVLTEQAYDREKSSIRSNIVFEARDELCNKDYQNLVEAQSAARKSGFSLGYGGLSIGSSRAKQSSSGTWKINETTFCQATSTDLQSASAGDYEKQVASIAVNAWRECVKSATENQLYIDYTVSRDGNRFTGTLRTTASTGLLARQITGIGVVGDAAPTVSCNIGGVKYKPSGLMGKAIEVLTTGTAVACEKKGEGGANIAFQTSQGAVDHIELPSKADIRVTDIDKITSDIQVLKKDLIDRFKETDKSTSLALDKSMSSFEKVTLYQCPSNTETNSRNWASFGCVGQLTNSNQCRNWWWEGELKSVPFKCDPVVYYKARQ